MDVLDVLHAPTYQLFLDEMRVDFYSGNSVQRTFGIAFIFLFTGFWDGIRCKQSLHADDE